jgi:hypothetical protein
MSSSNSDAKTAYGSAPWHRSDLTMVVKTCLTAEPGMNFASFTSHVHTTPSNRMLFTNDNMTSV